MFKRYAWTGNVRELRNVIERASILEDGELVTTEFLPADLIGKFARANSVAANRVAVLPPEGIMLEAVEVDLARQAMERTGGNLTQASKLLGISRDGLRYRLKKHGGNDLKPGGNGS